MTKDSLIIKIIKWFANNLQMCYLKKNVNHEINQIDN